MRVIINADDFGLNKEVNSAIATAIKKGAISSSTILANTIFIDDISSFVKAYPSCSYGVHLNVTEGVSLTQDEKLFEYGIIDEEGFFNKERSSVIFKSTPKSNLQELVYREWKAQVQRLLDHGIIPSHIDGHHHSHTWPGLVDVTIKLAEEFSIKRVRNMLNLPQNNLLSKATRRVGRALSFSRFGDLRFLKTNNRFFQSVSFNQRLDYYNKRLRECNLLTTDFFAQYSVFSSRIEQMRGIGNHTIELMCHPGHPLFEEEYNQILVKKIVNDNDLISYKDLY